MRRTSLIALAVFALGTGCKSRDARVDQLTDKRDVLLHELREISGYSDAKAETLRALEAQQGRNPALADVVDQQLRQVCLTVGSIDENASKTQVGNEVLDRFFSSPETIGKCREAWKVESEIRATLKGE